MTSHAPPVPAEIRAVFDTVPPAPRETLLRLHWKAKRPNFCGLYMHCQTSLVDQFRALYPAQFVYEGSRALLFPVGEPLSPELADCMTLALTYRLTVS